MTWPVFCAVLLAAAMHAGWNAVVKVGRDRFSSITLIAAAGAVAAACVIPFADVPRAAAWPWLLVSVALHVGYNLFLTEAYRSGDLGQVYPIARGTAPLLVAVIAGTMLGEALSPAADAGLAMLSGGIVLMALAGGRGLRRIGKRSLLFALGTSVFIAGYTLTDGIGSRLNGSAHGYAAWLFLLDGLAMTLIFAVARGPAGLRALRPFLPAGLFGGVLSLAAYWIVIWAMTRAPIGLVAALRETSVLFAAAIAVLVLHEPLTRWRVAASVAIVAGIIVARLG